MAGSQSLMTIVQNTNLSVHTRITLIKGKDKQISSEEEARAILAIPVKEVGWLENKNELPFAKNDALNFLKYGNRNLRDVFMEAGNYIQQKSSSVLKKVVNYFSDDKKNIAKK